MESGQKYYKNTTEFKDVWDAVQGNFECCGVTEPKDWYPVLGDNNVADSCCIVRALSTLDC